MYSSNHTHTHTDDTSGRELLTKSVYAPRGACAVILLENEFVLRDTIFILLKGKE